MQLIAIFQPGSHPGGSLTQKIVRIMRLTILLLAASLHLSAKTEGQKVTLRVRQAPMKDVFREIQKQTGLDILIDVGLLEKTGAVTLDVHDMPVAEVLTLCLKDQSLSYAITDGRIIVKAVPPPAFRPMEPPPPPPPVDIQGHVVDSLGNPLIGASVIVKGSKKGVETDGKGEFMLKGISDRAVLVVSFTGYLSREIKLTGEETKRAGITSLEITLRSDGKSQSEIVVVGYGTQNKRDLTGSISKVGSKEFDKAVFTTVDQLLQGRAAGVSATSTSGEPGAPVSIRIRGNNSLSGNNSPLYVVDGIPVGDIPNFNPQEIESMEILKDASAAAIYGSRGANGVILITTKRGLPGRSILEFSDNSSISRVLHTYHMLNGSDYANYRNEANVALGSAAPFPDPAQYAGKGFDWENEIFRNGVRNDAGLHISGGKDNVRYFISGDYLRDPGIILGSNYKRSSLRANIDADALNNRLTLQLNINTIQTNSNHAISASRGFPDQAGPIVNALMSEPIVPSKTYSGLTEEHFQFYNPFLEVTAKQDREFNTSVIVNTKAAYKITDALSNTLYAGYNYGLDTREIFYPSTVGQGINSLGVATSNTGRSYDYVLSDYLTYHKTFGGKHNLSATGGIEYSEFDDYSFNTNVSNFEVQSLGLDNAGIATSRNNVGSGRTKSILTSGFLRLNYIYNNKYLLTVTGRVDGSSRFAENRKWGYFPSVAAGWKVSEEPFMKEIEAISNLKLRVSIGQTGNQSIAPYQSLARYQTTVYPIGNVPVLGYIPNSVENPNLKWENTRQMDIGLDLSLLRNKIEFTFDYFDKRTDNLLQSIAIPSQSGFSSALVNFGSVENKGIEFSINLHPVNTGNFSWSSGFNYTMYKNTVNNLGGARQIFGPAIGTNLTGSGHVYMPGKEFGIFWGLDATGLIQQSDLDAAAQSGKPLPAYNNDRTLGHWKFKDLNSDGVINADDRMQIGNPNPDFIFGWNNEFSYKNFSLAILIQGTIGNDVYNTVGTLINEGFLSNQSYNNQTVEWYKKRWTPANPTNNIRFPSINSASPAAANYMVEDGSYVRFKNISLRYSLPVKRSVVTRLQFYVTGTNLITLTKYTGFDPEVSMLGPNTLAPGVDLGAYPRQSMLTFGMNLTF